MKRLLLLPVLIATVFASNHLDYLGQLAASADGMCRFTGENGVIDASSLPGFSSANLPIAGVTGMSTFTLSPCTPMNFTADCKDSFAYLVSGSSTCFSTPPINTVNGTGNTTAAFSTFKSGQVSSSFLSATTVTTLNVAYHCDEQGSNMSLALQSAVLRDETLTMVFTTSAICNLVPEPTPAPPTTTAPVDDGDDDHKLSSWAIVGIIVGAVVLIVGIGVACWKCRSSNPEEGEYRHVA